MMSMAMGKIFFAAVLMLFLQGCIYWTPMTVDYEVEIYLNGRRPDLKSDVCFIHYVANWGYSWGYFFYNKGTRDNNLRVFLLPQSLYDHPYRYGYIRNCDVAYPEDADFKSFQNVEIGMFTNSVRKCFDKFYRYHRNGGGAEDCYGNGASRNESNAGFALRNDSCWYWFDRTEESTNIAMEHTLQAILLRARYPNAPALHERRVALKNTMLYTNPRFPITTIARGMTSGERCELWTDDGVCAGSFTVKYPFYFHLSAGGHGGDEAQCAAMTQFLTMYCDKSKEGRFKGVVTSCIPLWGRSADVTTKTSSFKKISK